MKLKITTVGSPMTGKICQRLLRCDGLDRQCREFVRWVVDTREAACRSALIGLGWTPPRQPSKPTRANPMCLPEPGVDALLQDVKAFRDECSQMSTRLIPGRDPYGAVANLLTQLIDRHEVKG